MQYHRIISTLFTLLFLCTPLLASDQSIGDYLRRYELVAGYQYTIANQYEEYNGNFVPNRSIRNEAHAITIGAGFHLPVLTLAEQLGLGITTDLQLVIGSAPYDPAFPDDMERLDVSDGFLRLSLPVIAALKYGTDATFEPDTEVGVGAGVGYRLHRNLPLSYSYSEPVMMGELSFLYGQVLIKLRATGPIVPGKPDYPVEINTWDFSFVVMPGQ